MNGNRREALIHIQTEELEKLRRESADGKQDAGKKIEEVVEATVENLKERTKKTN